MAKRERQSQFLKYTRHTKGLTIIVARWCEVAGGNRKGAQRTGKESKCGALSVAKQLLSK